MATIATPLQQRLAAVRERLQKACTAARWSASGSAGGVTLVAVSKTFPAAAIREAAQAGQLDFGENYVQEAVEKMASLGDLNPIWHFIGPIQSNKTRAIAEHFTWVHSVDREKIARRLSEQRPEGLEPLQVCIEVNLSGEASKSGLPRQELAGLANVIAKLPRLRLRGLMTIPEPGDDMALRRQRFAELRGLLEGLKQDGLEVDTLSMGMSADLEIAVAEGATMVRIGTAIFGERTNK